MRDKNEKEELEIRSCPLSMFNRILVPTSAATAPTLPAVYGPQLPSLGYWSFKLVTRVRCPAHPDTFSYLLLLLVSQRSIPLDCGSTWREPTQSSTAPLCHPAPSELSLLILHFYELKSWFCDCEKTNLYLFLLCLY